MPTEHRTEIEVLKTQFKHLQDTTDKTLKLVEKMCDKLENQKADNSRVDQLEKRLDKIEESQTFVRRSVIGSFIASFIAFGFALLKTLWP